MANVTKTGFCLLKDGFIPVCGGWQTKAEAEQYQKAVGLDGFRVCFFDGQDYRELASGQVVRS